MKLQGFTGGIYVISLWVSRLAILNLLWLIGVIIGLVLFGFAPATIALFTLLRKIYIQKEDVAVVHTFIKVYKEQFIEGNKYGIPLLLIGAFLYLDFRIMFGLDHWLFIIIQILVITITILYIMLQTFSFSVYVHYDVSNIKNWKNAFILSVLHPLTVVANFLVLIIIGYVSLMVPGLFIFFTFSTMGLINVFLIFHRIYKHDQQVINEKA